MTRTDSVGEGKGVQHPCQFQIFLFYFLVNILENPTNQEKPNALSLYKKILSLLL